MRAFLVGLLAVASVTSVGVGRAGGSDEQARLAERLGSQQLGVPARLTNIDELRQRVGYEALDRQYRALVRMPHIAVAYAINGTASKITGSTGIYLPASMFKVDETAPKAMEGFGPVVLAAGTEELRVKRVHDPQGWLGPDGNSRPPERTIKFEQYIRGRPVLMGWANISVSEATGEVTEFVSHFLPDRGLPAEPTISAAIATEKLLAGMRVAAGRDDVELILGDEPPWLGYTFRTIDDQGAGSGELIWVITVTSKSGNTVQHLRALVSATNGEVLRFDSSPNSLNRTAYTAFGQTLPAPNYTGKGFLFAEGGIPNDARALEAYNNVGTVYNAYQAAFSRDSMNGAGGMIYRLVHYNIQVAGAAYKNGQLIFAVGGFGLLHPTANLDSVAHEFGHGVVAADAQWQTSDLTVDGAAALDEGYGDLSATIADVYVNGTPTSSTWTMLELFASNPAQGFRYWNIPNLANVQFRDWYPQRSLLRLNEGGQYWNSTILGHAFYLLVNGGNHYRAGLPGSGVPVISVPSVGYATTRNVFYTALSNNAIGPTSGFFPYRDATVQASPNSQVANAVRSAWDAVGVGYGCTAPPAIPNPILNPFYCFGQYMITWNPVPGATKYNAQVASSWGWAFAQTIVDANITQCMQNFLNQVMLRMRACNGCGCSAWSPSQDAPYYPGCL